MTNLKHILSVGLATATLAVVLTYVLGGQALLQSPYAEPVHNLVMSLMQGIRGPMLPESQMHAGPTSESHMQPPNYGIIGNNILGGPATLPAGGLAVLILYIVIPLAVAAFVISWNQRSFIVAGLLAVSGSILMIPPLIATGYLTVIVIPGPILGFISGLTIFGLGVIKGIRTAKTVVAAAR